jgi:D-alanyl-D-alanine dipeptidase
MLVDDIAQLIPTIKPEVTPFGVVPIKDCGEPLVGLAAYGVFAFETPHPYMAAGAPYGGKSPFMLRKTIADKLAAAHEELQKRRPGWRIKVFDGYRPVGVQAYMVAHTFLEIARGEGHPDPLKLADAVRDTIFKKVYRIWSPPNHDPLTPPPHSSGAAVDVTLVDEMGTDVDMGTPIDFNGNESNPDFFKETRPVSHGNRSLLREVMHAQGFLQHPNEWWHYSYGDQFWVWLQQKQNKPVKEAVYGRA